MSRNVVKQLSRVEFNRVVELLGLDPKVNYVSVSSGMYGADESKTDRMTVMRKGECRRIPVEISKKVDAGPLGLYVSWSLVSTIDGKVYKDKQDDTVTDDEINKAYMDVHGRSVPLYKNHDMTDRTIVGSVAFAPLTDDINKGLGLTSSKTGLVGFAHITDEDTKKAIADGSTPDMSIEAFAQSEDE